MIGIMLVPYKWLKQLMDVGCAIRRMAENVNYRDRGEKGVESPAAGLSKICRR